MVIVVSNKLITILPWARKNWPLLTKGEGHQSSITVPSSASRLCAQPFVQRKHQSSASLAFVRGINRWPVDSPHKGPVTRSMFPFDNVIMSVPYFSVTDNFGQIWHKNFQQKLAFFLQIVRELFLKFDLCGRVFCDPSNSIDHIHVCIKIVSCMVIFPKPSS